MRKISPNLAPEKRKTKNTAQCLARAPLHLSGALSNQA